MRALVLAMFVAGAAGCGGDGGRSKTAAGDSLTERQRDSILAKSRIPGASGVGRAMTAADSTSARIQQANQVATDTNPR